jgi:hypothetical protein
LLDLGRFFNFLILYIVGRTPWTGDQPVARPLPTHRINARNADIHALSGMGTHDPSVRADEDSSCLRPRGHGDRHSQVIVLFIFEEEQFLQREQPSLSQGAHVKAHMRIHFKHGGTSHIFGCDDHVSGPQFH